MGSRVIPTPPAREAQHPLIAASFPQALIERAQRAMLKQQRLTTSGCNGLLHAAECSATPRTATQHNDSASGPLSAAQQAGGLPDPHQTAAHPAVHH